MWLGYIQWSCRCDADHDDDGSNNNDNPLQVVTTMFMDSHAQEIKAGGSNRTCSMMGLQVTPYMQRFTHHT